MFQVSYTYFCVSRLHVFSGEQAAKMCHLNLTCSGLSIIWWSLVLQGSFRGALSPAPQKASATSPRKRGGENAVVHFFRTMVSKPLCCFWTPDLFAFLIFCIFLLSHFPNLCWKPFPQVSPAPPKSRVSLLPFAQRLKENIYKIPYMNKSDHILKVSPGLMARSEFRCLSKGKKWVKVLKCVNEVNYIHQKTSRFFTASLCSTPHTCPVSSPTCPLFCAPPGDSSPPRDGPSHMPPLPTILFFCWVRHVFFFCFPPFLFLVFLTPQWRGLAAKIGLVGCLRFGKGRQSWNFKKEWGGLLHLKPVPFSSIIRPSINVKKLSFLCSIVSREADLSIIMCTALGGVNAGHPPHHTFPLRLSCVGGSWGSAAFCWLLATWSALPWTLMNECEAAEGRRQLKGRK